MSFENLSYTKKILEARITLAEGGFNPGTGQAANTKILRLGMSVDITKPGGKEKNKAKVRIFNMSMQDMETLATLAFAPLKSANNAMAIYAGDKGHGLSLAFSGDIVAAVPVFSGVPDPSMDFECVTGYMASITPTPPLSAQGTQDVAQTLARLAKEMGLSFVNRGVSVSLRNTCWVGGPMEQATQLADAARISMIIDDGEMIISQPGVLREDDGPQTPVWKDSTGLFGYPSFDNDGIVVKGLYEPKCRMGGPLRVESIVPRASGLWQITSISHRLQANYPQGAAWETSIKASYPGADQGKKTEAKK